VVQVAEEVLVVQPLPRPSCVLGRSPPRHCDRGCGGWPHYVAAIDDDWEEEQHFEEAQYSEKAHGVTSSGESGGTSWQKGRNPKAG